MTNKRITPIKTVSNLVDNTKSSRIEWVNVNRLKIYLKRDDISLGDIPNLHKYLIHLQKERFIFDCIDTYISVYMDDIYIISKSRYSSEYRIDIFSLNSDNSNWQKLDVPISLILRLRNAIVITEQDNINYNDCQELLYAISQEVAV